MVRYLGAVPDPDRGFALAALTGTLSFRNAKPAMLRQLINERTDERLFALSYDFVGDLSETIALMWPADEVRETDGNSAPSLSEIVTVLESAKKAEVPEILARWLDALDETGRWALLKLITGGLRVGVSARLAKTAAARLGDVSPDRIEEIWHGLSPPYLDMFAWLEGRAGLPEVTDPAPFRPVMLAHPLDEDKDIARYDATAFAAEWKWDGIRIQAASGFLPDGSAIRRLYSRTGEDISAAFPDILACLDFEAAVDGELLVISDGKVRPFSDLQRRLNRKTAGPKLLRDYPAAIRIYDLLSLDGTDLRNRPFRDRRAALEAFVERCAHPSISLSALVDVRSWDGFMQARAEPDRFLATGDADAVEGLMLKQWDSPYLPGRPKGHWFKWKRDPFFVDAVLMYAQRGHGKRSSYYSDYTFGVWRKGDAGAELVPVGKAYFGFTDDELAQIDRFVRNNTINRFGPVREVVHTADQGLVIEVAFEGLNRSTRHKSGLAMRFPRISRLRWDKTPGDADTIDSLAALLPANRA